MENESKKAVSKNIYDFIRMENPNGEFMCYSSNKRAKWYMDRKLATWVDNTTFRLNFIPRGNGKAHVPYYHEKVENRCVCCGTYQNMTRHHVFPYMFKSKVPLHYKSRSNYDILPVCSDCHEEYERSADNVKAELKSMIQNMENKNFDKEKIKYIKSVLASRKFIEQYESNPDFYKNVPKEKVEDYLAHSKQEIDIEMLSDFNLANQLWVDKLMEKVCETENTLFNFVVLWRKHFVDTMKPKYLPNLWVVDMELEVTNEYKQAQEQMA